VLKADIEGVGKRRAYLRARRKRSDVPVVALVGYTNAGKTTLFNVMTGAEAAASHALFVTLGPLVRRVRLADARQILLSDTVGFIDRLPHQLVAAFRATLEEVAAADLLLHVIDSSSPDRERQIDAVHSVLREVGAGEVPTLDVFNKIDRLEVRDLARIRAGRADALFVSATDASCRPVVVDAMIRGLAMDAERVRLSLSTASEDDRKLLAQLYRQARVVSQVGEDGMVTVEADVPRRMLARVRQARVSS
jgi:GTP-binding protein HflX